MKWCNFLHFYQPANQQRDILESVVNQCYRPLFTGLLKKDKARLTINISGALLELLEKHDFMDVIDSIRQLHAAGKLELTSTACYHAFLPLLDEKEIVRQVELNNTMLKLYIGSDFTPKGFFPPEMACNTKLVKIIANMGFDYIILDEIAHQNYSWGVRLGNEDHTFSNTSLHIFYRQRVPSNILMSGIERDSSSISSILNDYKHQDYLITAMDGETFGHHRPGLEVPFLELFDNEDIQFAKIEDLLSQRYPSVSTSVVDSTWATSLDDISKGSQFISWKDPHNILHTWQWELVDVMLDAVNSLTKTESTYLEIRVMVDKALASDQFFWASASPWWSVEMIEGGAYACLSVLEKISNLSPATLEHARTLYRNIISTAFDWQRTGKIREISTGRNVAQRIPFKTRTLEAGGTETAVYQAFIAMMKSQEAQAAKSGEYEKAILWRDAVYKIETKNDIYDAINAIDLLRIDISNERVEDMITKYKEDYYKIRGGQPEQRSN